MNDIPIQSATYQSLEALLHGKHPSVRFQQVREREAKGASDQAADGTTAATATATATATVPATPTQLLSDRSRRASRKIFHLCRQISK